MGQFDCKINLLENLQMLLCPSGQATLSIVGTTTLYTVGLTEDEELMVSQLADSLEADHARDEIAETYLYYCT
ncbi:hypothetical protein BDDG_11831 [Blastomyces dermatitidis ATCC 18188]|uniref:Uncharacterized protein n=1 Tax=Ajellomyces dermatitidis (strain ATCC 18188 / CBS 674.68) TaxID=653446 RepID=A0A0J9EKV8_AJEDA|nr:hypothetical protein BDDG_11831 [Blastomyces dermatitidis ATCC 18188]